MPAHVSISSLPKVEEGGLFHQAFAHSLIFLPRFTCLLPTDTYFNSWFCSVWNLHNAVKCPGKNLSIIRGFPLQSWYFFTMGSQSFLEFSPLLQLARAAEICGKSAN